MERHIEDLYDIDHANTRAGLNILILGFKYSLFGFTVKSVA